VENVIPAEEQAIARITDSVSQLLDLSSKAGFPEEYKKLLEGYYAQKIQQRRDSMEELKTRIASKSERPNSEERNEPVH
jgi:hypothetical protein